MHGPVRSRLILLRHGQSTFNAENRFAGWTDVPLSEKGRHEARESARLLADLDEPELRRVYTSVLERAVVTTDLILEATGQRHVEVVQSYRLNERHYGVLEGRNKVEAAAEYGESVVHRWRRGYRGAPPPVSPDDPRHPANDAKYQRIPAQELPATESLADAIHRLAPIWVDGIIGALVEGGTILVCAHGSTARAILTILENLSEQEILDLNIPNGFPLLCEIEVRDRTFDRGSTREPTGLEEPSSLATSVRLLSRRYLGRPADAEAAALRVAQQATVGFGDLDIN